MKSFAIVAILVFGLSAVLADRPKAKTIIETLNAMRPRYREIQDFVIETLSDARLNTSAKLNVFHQDVLLVKETFVLDAIKKEDALLYQINNQPSSVDRTCLAFVQSLGDSVMNLAGTGFSSCISDANDVLSYEVTKFYNLLQGDESAYVGIGLLDVFKGENVFFGPDSILEKLTVKTKSIEAYPEHIFDQMYASVNAFGNTLDVLENTYISCMTNSEQMLKGGFALTRDHMAATCRAVEVPAPGVPDTEVVPDAQPETVPVHPESELLKAFRQRFGV